MGRCFTFVIGLLCIIYISGQTTQKICWDAMWYNDSGIQSNGSNYEQQTVKVLNKICTNGPVIDAQCKDDKGEPFQKINNDTANHFIATCSPVNGLICQPYKNARNATCPDFAIQYGCNCPPTTTTTRRTSTASMQGGGKQTVPAGAGNLATTQGVAHSSTGGVTTFGTTGTGTTTLKTGNGSEGWSSNGKGGSGNTGSQTTGSGTGPSASGQQNNHCRNNGQHYRTSHSVMLLCMIVVKVSF